MWSNEDRWAAAEREFYQEAVRQTDDEIFTDALGIPDANFRDHNDTIVDQLSRTEDWEGNDVEDSELVRETTGEIPQGMAGLSHSEREEALASENGALRNHIAQMQQFMPQEERPDMFANPDEWEANLLAQHRGEGGIPLQDYGRETPGKPDMFADPEGYERWMLAEMDRRSGVEQHHTARVNASLAAAHQIHGADFEQAYADITSMDTRDRRAQEWVRAIVNSPDPGSALMQTWGALHGAGFAARRFGGAPFAPMLRSASRSPHAGSAARGRGDWMDGRTLSPEQQLEDHIADSAWDD
jgi:hypothetical protein